jgi:hypothetical protein
MAETMNPAASPQERAESLLRRLFQGESNRGGSSPFEAVRCYSTYTADLESCTFVDAGAIHQLLSLKLLVNVPFSTQECIFQYLTHSVIQHVCNQEAAKEVNTLAMVLDILENVVDERWKINLDLLQAAVPEIAPLHPVDLAVIVSIIFVLHI